MAQISWTKKSLKDLKAINDYIPLTPLFMLNVLFLRFLTALIN